MQHFNPHHPQGPISEKIAIQGHIYDFYKELLGTTTPRLCGLAVNAWGRDLQGNQQENNSLALTLSKTELEQVVMDMKSDTAPEPNGFPGPLLQEMPANGKTRGFTHCQ
jgi:hypothetical protein